METAQFDGVIRYLRSRRLSRRNALIAGATGAIGLAGRSSAQESTPSAGPRAEVDDHLFVQIFGAGKVDPVEGETDVVTLLLPDGVGQSVYFADRPNRQVGVVATNRLLEVVSAQTDDPVNAAVIAETPDGGTEFVILELLQGEVTSTSEVSYKGRLLRKLDDFDMHLEQEPVTDLSTSRLYEAVHLFIDGLSCNPGDPHC